MSAKRSPMLTFLMGLADFIEGKQIDDGHHVLFWSSSKRPQDFVRTDVSKTRKTALVQILRAGSVLETYMGRAQCRICGADLGNKDLGIGPQISARRAALYLWPEGAEHYVIEHGVWTPECDTLLASVNLVRSR